ncbi:hypothetical protein SAMN05216276_108819 [Streptosporangium subroseum]|uniref:Uncharacterized protein n=1 Tax=Streptosporangium subroseum TaxID=106412 RepID=A0A239P6B4_9ACTN|nr:hypothetical protein [Streptosporangium subroseum]SNT62158.1 hypothetical protein SAMN05216276_108819 [Streptosporangium subroseum]
MTKGIFREEALRRHAGRERRVTRPIKIGGWWLALLWAAVVLLILTTAGLVLLAASQIPGATS